MILLIVLCLGIQLWGEAPDTLWTETYGGYGNDVGFDIQETRDGSYIIAGFTLSHGANGDVYLVKVDSTDGKLTWERNYGGEYVDGAYSVQQTIDGGYIIGGVTESFSGDQTEDAYLIKTDSLGDTLWTRAYGGRYNDCARAVQQTSDGGYIIAGYTEILSNRDAYVIKTNSLGDTVWTQTYGGGYWEEASSIDQTPDKGYIVAGYAESYSESDDVLLMKLDSLGNISWVWLYGGYRDDNANSIQVTSDGGYIIAGATLSFGFGYDYENCYLIKTDEDAGPSQWQRTYGGFLWDVAMSAKQTSDGGYIIAGLTASFSAGWEDVYVIKTDSNGYEEWSKTYGGYAPDIGYEVQQTSTGAYVVVGSTYSFGQNSYDVWLLKIGFEKVSEEDVSYDGLFNWACTPNPFRMRTCVQYTIFQSSDVRIVIYDLLGQAIKTLVDAQQSAGAYRAVWDRSDDTGTKVANSVYVVQLHVTPIGEGRSHTSTAKVIAIR